jgi:hypothetical protein
LDGNTICSSDCRRRNGWIGAGAGTGARWRPWQRPGIWRPSASV